MRHLPVALTVVTLTAAVVVHAQDGPYRFSKEIRNRAAREDGTICSVNPAAHRLYASHSLLNTIRI